MTEREMTAEFKASLRLAFYHYNQFYDLGDRLKAFLGELDAMMFRLRTICQTVLMEPRLYYDILARVLEFDRQWAELSSMWTEAMALGPRVEYFVGLALRAQQ
ncbi:hypothetical protein FBEOM_13983 [Fusarium beomiforme]|uniref:Uncharacterized protein n=1 Tax=Fusarium beomiforme TaxID=44412 RepID=A0A9P5A4S8_9HYPO|nr:hypothetical protein FBEOM_13983 [Fusarium beomiforme]